MKSAICDVGSTARCSVAAVVSLVSMGCQQVQKPGLPAGAASFHFVEPMGTLARGEATRRVEERRPVDTLEPPQPILPLEPPVYPAVARGRQRIPMTVGVRIVVAADGTVSQTGRSLRAFTTPGPLADEFRVAAETAVANWRFVPAELRHMVPKQGGPEQEYWQVTRAEKTDYALDVLFTFSPSGEIVSERR